LPKASFCHPRTSDGGLETRFSISDHLRVHGVAAALAQCTQPAFDAGEALLQFADGAHALPHYHVRDAR
jgi:hypothetical protein